jgi:hypothetical protein
MVQTRSGNRSDPRPIPRRGRELEHFSV